MRLCYLFIVLLKVGNFLSWSSFVFGEVAENPENYFCGFLEASLRAAD